MTVIKNWKRFSRGLLCYLLILTMILLVQFVVYRLGGTEFAFTHLMYFPIVLAAFLCGIGGSLSAALIAGVAIGPFMPLNVSNGTMQEPESWILRTAFFLVMGLVVGLLFRRIKNDQIMQTRKSYRHDATGYPNMNQLKNDLKYLIKGKEHFTLTVYKIINLGYISRFVDEQIENKAVFKVLEALSDCYGKENAYCIDMDVVIVVMRGYTSEASLQKAKALLHQFTKPVLIDRMPVDLILKGGIASFPKHSDDVDGLLKKLRITLDLDQLNGNSVSIYENAIVQRNKNNYEMIISLFEAIRNNELFIVYQPKINLKKKEVMGVEALLRWNSGTWGNVNPEEFIALAEYAGMINEITRWVIKNVIAQLKKWEQEAICMRVAVNISSKDLKDHSIIEYTKKYMDNQVQPEMLEFELTERTIADSSENVEHLLNDISALGLKISLDDFGTGYNSPDYLVKLPINFVKLDKYFIRHIHDISSRPLIEGFIKTAHTLGIEIIAEGVETEEQVKILSDMGCDHIQGYYYSKPLSPEKVKEFVLNFNQKEK